MTKTKISPPIFPIRSYSPNERFTMDYTQFAPNVWFLIVIANFSKRVWGDVYPSKQEKNVIRFLQEIMDTEGTFCEILQSDNGGEFIGNDLRAFLKGKCIAIHGRPFHPQSQATIERFNGTIKTIVTKYCKSRNVTVFSIEELQPVLKICLDIYMRQIHSSTNFRPYELHYGIVLATLRPMFDYRNFDVDCIHHSMLGTSRSEEEIRKMRAVASRNQCKRNARNFKQAYLKHL
jgi:transposase InsO family protein